jgi:hypothetical protein
VFFSAAGCSNPIVQNLLRDSAKSPDNYDARVIIGNVPASEVQRTLIISVHEDSKIIVDGKQQKTKFTALNFSKNGEPPGSQIKTASIATTGGTIDGELKGVNTLENEAVYIVVVREEGKILGYFPGVTFNDGTVYLAWQDIWRVLGNAGDFKNFMKAPDNENAAITYRLALVDMDMEKDLSAGGNAYLYENLLQDYRYIVDFRGCTGKLFKSEKNHKNAETLIGLYLPDALEEIGDFSFYGCVNFSEGRLPGSLVRLGEGAFAGLTLNGGITLRSDKLISIGNGAFKGCKELKDLTINSKIIEEIGEEALMDCSSLLTITIPASVTSIGDKAFMNCASLSEITFKMQNIFDSELKLDSNNTFTGIYETPVVYVPKGNLEDYKTWWAGNIGSWPDPTWKTK